MDTSSIRMERVRDMVKAVLTSPTRFLPGVHQQQHKKKRSNNSNRRRQEQCVLCGLLKGDRPEVGFMGVDDMEVMQLLQTTIVTDEFIKASSSNADVVGTLLPGGLLALWCCPFCSDELKSVVRLKREIDVMRDRLDTVVRGLQAIVRLQNKGSPSESDSFIGPELHGEEGEEAFVDSQTFHDETGGDLMEPDNKLFSQSEFTQHKRPGIRKGRKWGVGIGSWACKICGLKVTNSQNCRRHLRNKHKIKPGMENKYIKRLYRDKSPDSCRGNDNEQSDSDSEISAAHPQPMKRQRRNANLAATAKIEELLSADDERRKEGDLDLNLVDDNDDDDYIIDQDRDGCGDSTKQKQQASSKSASNLEGSTLYTCLLCGRNMSISQNMRRHIRNVHKIQSGEEGSLFKKVGSVDDANKTIGIMETTNHCKKQYSVSDDDPLTTVDGSDSNPCTAADTFSDDFVPPVTENVRSLNEEGYS